MGNRNVIFLIVLFTSTKEDKLHVIYAIVSITFPETMRMLSLFTTSNPTVILTPNKTKNQTNPKEIPQTNTTQRTDEPCQFQPYSPQTPVTIPAFVTRQWPSSTNHLPTVNPWQPPCLCILMQAYFSHFPTHLVKSYFCQSSRDQRQGLIAPALLSYFTQQRTSYLK